MAILTNLIIFLVALYYFNNLKSIQSNYIKLTAKFVLFIGFATCFSSIGHGMQLQMGEIFFRIILFISHVFNLVALYFCFKAAYTLKLNSKAPNKFVLTGAIAVAFILIILSVITRSFLIIKIPAGIVLIYSLIAHYGGVRKNDKGSSLFVIGILIAFASILVHSLRISMSEWFNHKDIAHVFISISLVFMCRVAKSSSSIQHLESVPA